LRAVLSSVKGRVRRQSRELDFPRRWAQEVELMSVL
jgi:hypothetical protein